MDTTNKASDRNLWIDRFSETARRIIPELTIAQTRELSERCHANAYRLTPKGLAIHRK
jgi:hypothetical protein